jgi:hypothetical protein
MKNAQALLRFIFSLLIVGGITAGLIWANCNDKKTHTQKPVEEEEQCAGGPASIEHGAVLEWGRSEDYPKKGELVTFEGFVEMPNMTYLNGGTYLVNLSQDSAFSGGSVTLMIVEGDCENTMAPLPDDYADSDLLIYDNSGKKIMHGDKVRVSGKVKDDGAMFMVFVKRIEKL